MRSRIKTYLQIQSDIGKIMLIKIIVLSFDHWVCFLINNIFGKRLARAAFQE